MTMDTAAPDAATRTVDGGIVSAADAARLAAEAARFAQHQRQAARVVAGASTDLADCRLLLDVLGLDADVVRAARGSGRRQRARA